YVAVYWEDKWARGIVSMESCFMIWLVDQGVYIRPTENTVYLYTSRRLHRACLLKPELPTKDLPSITPPTTLAQYSAICDMVEPFCTQDEEDTDTHSAGGSSVTYEESKENTSYKKLQFSPSEIEMFSNETINVAGREYNLLAVLVNKARDIYMCERYKDAKSVGRATTRIKDCI
ncbi:Uncharacterized protein OBRU01_10726, partial [Operophtera brumata]